jgi:hypothetical protein
MRHQIRSLLIFTLIFTIRPALLLAEQGTGKATASGNAAALAEEAAADGRYALLLFYKQSDEPTRAMLATLKTSLAGDADRAAIVPVQVGSSANQGLVAKYDISRAPMPMLLAVAPNGAVTGVFAQKVTSENVLEVFVTPTMMTAMKSLQEGKLVFVAVYGASQTAAPPALKGFQTDPHFKSRMVILKAEAGDPLEAKLMSQMQIDPRTKLTQTVLLAPPGVLVGKFEAAATKDDIAGALAQAGKCCDDPNCKHHQQAPPRTASPAPSAKRK